MGSPHAHLRILIAAGLVVLVAPTAITAQPVFSVLHSFAGRSDGSRPYGALIQATDGNFYGTTGGGGAFDAGTVFRMSPTGTVTVLHAFAGGLDGSGPGAAVIQATDGNFYGTTTSGGASSSLCTNGCGTVFKMTPDGAVTTLHVFAGTDGRLPEAALIQASDGTFYGTTTSGGALSPSPACARGCGTVFKMTPAGTVTVLHAFDYAHGAYPTGSLIQATDGDFYGTTVGERVGGTSVPFASIAFKMTSAGTFTVLHDFAFGGLGGAVDAANGALIQAADGNFYGTSSGLNVVPCFNQCGKVFRMTPDGGVFFLHRFTGGTDGSYPSASLIQAADGNFYGMTTSGGGPPCASFFAFPFPCHGTVFKMAPTGIVTTLHAFTGGADGTGASTTLIQASDGSFYGTTTGDGEFGGGLVFRFIMTPHLLDLNGNGRGDVFLYNQATGERRIELANGLTTGFTESPGRWDPGWQIYPVNLNQDAFTDFFLYDPARGLWVQALNHSGDGTFTYTFGHWEQNWTVVPADLDGDGLRDLLVYNATTGVWVGCFVDGVGGFKIYTAGRWDPRWTFYTADLNGDRRDDFLLYNRERGVWVEVFSQGWLGGFDYPASGQWGPGWELIPANLNGDDRMDLVLLNATGAQVSALGRAGGGFDYVVGPQWSPGWTVAPGDLNKDGTDDLFLYNPVTGVWVEAFSDGTGGFTYTAGQWDPGWAVAVTHFNGDGVPDLILSRADGTWVQATATGAGTFTYIVGNWGPAWTVFARSLGAG